MNTSIAGCGINIPGHTPGEYRLSGIKQPRENKKKEDAKEITPEQQMIDQFKEENSPENNRVSEIYGKFRAGKELTAEELDYLAKHSPEIYNEIKEIMMERKALEARMKLAKTKQEVHAVVTNESAAIKKTMGTGEQAKRGAMKTMARTNQMADAGQKFLASAEYREKEDERTQAEDRKETLEEYEEQLLEQQELLLEKSVEAMEAVKEPEHTDGLRQEEERTYARLKKVRTDIDDNTAAAEVKEDGERARRRRRRSRNEQEQFNEAAGGMIKLVTKDDLRRRFEMAGSGGSRVDIKL